jgi:hypothetical protein
MPVEEFVGYCRQWLADDPHLWSTTLFDEIVGLGIMVASGWLGQGGRSRRRDASAEPGNIELRSA